MSARRRVLDDRIDPVDLQPVVAVLREGSISAAARAGYLPRACRRRRPVRG